MRLSSAGTRSTKSSLRIKAVALASVAGLALLSTASPAKADDVSPTGKGIVGGALLGGEAVTIIESMAGVRNGWAYFGGALAGAAAGGVGGYFVEQNSSDGRAPVYMLAGGVGLIIPALVLALDATRYMPAEGALDESQLSATPAANPGAPGGSAVSGAAAGGAPAAAPAPAPAPAPAAPPAAAPAPAPAPATPPAAGGATPPLSLFDVRDGSMRMGVPVPEIRSMYTLQELKTYGVAQQTEVRMPVLKVVF